MLFVLLHIYCPIFAQENLILFYNKPAKEWTDALPIGNGRIGAMIFGDPRNELLQLNESSFWSGGPVNTRVNDSIPMALSEVRKALLVKNDYGLANRLVRKIQGEYTQSFLPLADLHLIQDIGGDDYREYKRELNIENSRTTVQFNANHTLYRREVIASHPANAIVIHLTASQAAKISFKLSLTSQVNYQVNAIGSDRLILKAKAPSQVDPNYVNYNKQPVQYNYTDSIKGMRAAVQVKVITRGGTVENTASNLVVHAADEVTIILTAATSYNGFDKSPLNSGKDETKVSERELNNASKLSWQKIFEKHVADYREFFDRVKLNLGKSPDGLVDLPTDKRLINFSKGAIDPEFESLLYQYGRYLLISSSRAGSPPANLQGIWNNILRAPWSSNYTININTQMNYWPAAITGLSELETPLFDLVKNLSVTGRKTAQHFYNMRGWVAHHNTDIWAISNPVGDFGKGDPMWANWFMGGPWLCRHLFEHYRFTHDRGFLKRTYPIMKGAAEFLVDFLVEDKDGFLITAPSFSPENEYLDSAGNARSTTIATTMDMSIIRDHFRNCIESAQILGIDSAFKNLLKEKLNKLYPLHIGKKGNLQEWYKDWEDRDPHHRHVSHLFGLHPGREISPLLTPEFSVASRKTLEMRGDAGTGWSLAWKINFWARLYDGDHAYKLLRDLMRDVDVSKGGGLYHNLFDAHPPFQIDGNFGAVSGMSEMLLQSHLDTIFLLPALPKDWNKGFIKGLRARGAFTIDISWEKGQINSAKIYSAKGGICAIRTRQPISINGSEAKSVLSEEGTYLTSFKTNKNRYYTISKI